jgi:hypothetical protein
MESKSYALDTSIIFGTTIFDKKVEYNVQTVNLPGITVAHPELTNKSGSAIFMQSDTLTYSELSLTIILDEGFAIWSELVSYFHKMVNNQTGALGDVEGDSYVSITDTSGNVILKVWFRNSKLETVGDLSFASSNTDENLILDISLKYDYFELEDVVGPDATEWDLTDVTITADATTDIDGNYTGVVSNVVEN